MDPNLRTCGRKGHATYRPEESDLADRLRAETAIGTSWRCLRCGDFVLGEPAGSGPAADAPVLLRGKALRDATVLKLLAVERILRAILLIGVGYVVLRFRHSEGDFQALFNKAIPAAEPLARVLHFDLDHSPTIAKLRHLLQTSPRTLLLVALAVFGYAAINLIEATGLWLMKRWGEYFATVATSIFLPLEIYELNERITFLRVAAFIINLAAIAYLVYSKRLFGVRGGRAAFEAERHSQSLLEVEESADQRPEQADDQPARTTATDSPGMQ
ncbi:MAG TPA: DUF2127 domain-containing protein [Frankiaceae bacterium]|nr:DUF2127 domain-containing protein [Frankiaceae bacterium]